MYNQKGFALLGLLIVLTIIALLVGGVRYRQKKSEERVSQIGEGIGAVEKAEMLHEIFNERNAATQEQPQ